MTPIDDVTSCNELHSKLACYIHSPSWACNLFKARTRNRGETTSLNVSELPPPPPSPAERNCVIMPDSFYHSNRGHCLCKRLAPLCASEQPRHYIPAAENESTNIGSGEREADRAGRVAKYSKGLHGRRGGRWGS